jgi:hypothetical protein
MAILKRHPLIVVHLRELLISLGKTGDIALYSYEVGHDAVLILAIRHQREAGFTQ